MQQCCELNPPMAASPPNYRCNAVLSLAVFLFAISVILYWNNPSTQSVPGWMDYHQWGAVRASVALSAGPKILRRFFVIIKSA